LANGTKGSQTTEKFSKGTYTWNILELAGITTEEQATQVRSITIQQSGANGGARIYEMYVKVPDTNGAGIESVKAAVQTGRTMKVLENGRLVIVKNGERYNVAGQKM
jgi:hypothetical protein